MRSKVHKLLPFSLKRKVDLIGTNIKLARKKRKWTIGNTAKRCQISVQTYRRVENSDSTVSFAAYAMVLYILGMANDLDKLAAPEFDQTLATT
ncbi:DNA-binding protein [Abyssogena phaseoliformis symbiont OG214]|uniref:helix-turn-helix domain-containing protein n=1 Tax=Abyssogena phaseoliformis symbiont TaxID=596095 RepID=UPI001935C6FD|nr:helix-turn-helix transcriptional regulator [Abyssogena phaseoliformis symbiont]BBB22566.1 DNA-binding protein [Abyssogena phaseoliformis symbiont OG214]